MHRQFVALEENLRAAAEIQREKLGQRHRDAVEHLFQRTDGRADPILLDQRDEPVGDPSALGQFALRQAVQGPYCPQVRAHIDA